MKFRRGRLALTIALLAAAAFQAQPFARARAGSETQGLAALPILTAATAKHFGMFQPIAVSPDRQLVVYTICDERRRTSPSTQHDAAYFGALGCDLQMVDRRRHSSVTIAQGGDNAFPVWSPNGERLAFLSDKNGTYSLYVWNRSTKTATQVSAARLRPFSVPVWLPSSDAIAIITASVANKSGAPASVSSNILSGGPEAPGAHVKVFRSPENLGPEERKRYRHDIASSPLISLDSFKGDLSVVSLTQKTTRIVARDIASTIFGIVVSPDGSKLAYVDDRGFGSDSNQNLLADIVVLSTKDWNVIRTIPNNKVGFAPALTWSPTSQALVWVGGVRSVAHVSVYDFSQKRLTECAAPVPNGASFVTSGDGELIVWNRAGTRFYLAAGLQKSGSLAQLNAVWEGSPTSRQLRLALAIPERRIEGLFSGRIGEADVLVAQTLSISDSRAGLFAIDPTSARYRTIYEANTRIDGAELTPDRSALFFYRQSADQGPDIWMADAGFAQSSRITHINPAFDHYAFGKGQLISWTTDDGQVLRGALMLPPAYVQGERYPLVVYPYGSAYKSKELNNFGFGEDNDNTENLQILATRGYAVLLPDAPVHTGTPMRDIARTILPGIDKAVALGFADPNRLAVMGHSYGGYTVMALIAQTNRFKAAISRAGFSDWTAIYSEMMPDGTAYGLTQAESNQYGLGGGPWTVRRKFIENSPYYLFDRVTTPVLIIYGTVDAAVAPYNAEISFVALRHLHKDVALVQYVGEDHAESEWSFPDKLDYMMRIVKWFDKYLCPHRVSDVKC